MGKIRFLKKALSASGSVIRVLVGAGAFILLVAGLKSRRGEDTEGAGSERTSPQMEGREKTKVSSSSSGPSLP